MVTINIEMLKTTKYNGIQYIEKNIYEVPSTIGNWLVARGLANILESKEQHGSEVFDIKDAKISHYSTKTVAEANNAAIHGAIILLTMPQQILTNIKNPDYPRKLSVTGHKAGDSLTGTVIIYGTDAFDNVINDSFALNGNATVNGTKLFKTVTKIVVPAGITELDYVKIGTVARSIPLAADTAYILPVRTLVENVTITVASTAVSVADNTITSTGHGFPNGEYVKFTTSGTAPGGLIAGNNYYVVNTASDTFKLSLTLGGNAIDLTTQGTGNHTFTEVIQGFINPDIPRVLSVTGGMVGATHITSKVTINGTDDLGKAITEDITLNDDNTVPGTLAFETITSIILPAFTTTGDTVKVGITDTLGLGVKLAENTVISAYLNGVKESSNPTVTVDSDEISKNTVKLSSSLVNGEPVDIYFLKD